MAPQIGGGQKQHGTCLFAHFTARQRHDVVKKNGINSEVHCHIECVGDGQPGKGMSKENRVAGIEQRRCHCPPEQLSMGGTVAVAPEVECYRCRPEQAHRHGQCREQSL